MRKVKHKYVCNEPNDYVHGTVSFTVKAGDGSVGVYESYGPQSMSNWLTKMKALRHLVRRKHEIINSQCRVQRKGKT